MIHSLILRIKGTLPFAASGGVLYGATQQGGSSGSGTLFAINTDGSGSRTFTPLEVSALSPQEDIPMPTGLIRLPG
jgi:uncharacterized repeat protein (TIGR03803 family)